MAALVCGVASDDNANVGAYSNVDCCAVIMDGVITSRTNVCCLLPASTGAVPLSSAVSAPPLDDDFESGAPNAVSLFVVFALSCIMLLLFIIACQDFLCNETHCVVLCCVCMCCQMSFKQALQSASSKDLRQHESILIECLAALSAHGRSEHAPCVAWLHSLLDVSEIV